MFRSLSNRNYRLYFVGQLVSLAGTFMQTVGQAWLVLKLTGSGTALGLVTTLQYLPILVLGGMAGVILDRVDRRRVYMWTQTLAGLEALVLGVLTVTGLVQLWMVYVLAFVLGIITALDQPVRGTMVLDLVGPDDLTNAISLNMAMGNAGRAVGPAIAGLTIAALGIGACFLVNAASFGAVLIALVMMRPEEMHPAALQPRQPRQLRDGFAYVRRTPEVRALLVMAALVFGLAWEYDVVLPLAAKFTFGGGAETYGVMSAAVGIGAIVGALTTARTNSASARLLVAMSGTFAVGLLAAALAPTIQTELVALAVVGGAGIAFAAVANSRLQLRTAPGMRGRVMAFWSMAVIGTRPLGGPITGFVGEHAGARWALALGAGGIVVLALPLWWLLGRADRSVPAPELVEVPPDVAAPALETTT
jgi:MFS family permease